MKSLNKLSLSTLAIALFGTFIMGVYNTSQMTNVSFMSADVGIKFTKRLDELNGKFEGARMAASTPLWSSQKITKKVIQVNKEIIKPQIKEVKKEVIAEVEPVEQIQEYAVEGELDLSIKSVFYKKPLEAGSFSGSVQVDNGVVQNISLALPNGDAIEISTREEMVGNVFKYTDAVTGDEKSGMLYEVVQGKKYLVTLANDSKYPGIRIELESDQIAQVAYKDNASWDMENQNKENQASYSNSIDDVAVKEIEYNQNDAPQVINQEPVGFNFNI